MLPLAPFITDLENIFLFTVSLKLCIPGLCCPSADLQEGGAEPATRAGQESGREVWEEYEESSPAL